jgi:hypothetical protein
MTLTVESIIAIAAAVVSFGSMCAAIGSAATARKNARIAEQAKEQAKKAATLTQRIEAINHIRNALEDIIGRNAETRDALRTPASERYLNIRPISETMTSIRRAKHLSEIVFSKGIRNNLDSALQHAGQFADFTEKGVIDLHSVLNLTLRTDLQSLIDQMNVEAALAGNATSQRDQRSDPSSARSPALGSAA